VLTLCWCCCSLAGRCHTVPHRRAAVATRASPRTGGLHRYQRHGTPPEAANGYPSLGRAGQQVQARACTPLNWGTPSGVARACQSSRTDRRLPRVQSPQQRSGIRGADHVRERSVAAASASSEPGCTTNDWHAATRSGSSHYMAEAPCCFTGTSARRESPCWRAPLE